MTETPEQTPQPSEWSRGRIVGVLLSSTLALGLVVLLVLGLATKGDPLEIDHAIERGERVAAPDFTLPIFANGGALGDTGAPLRLSSLQGRPVVINFWASWCGPCRSEAPIIERLHRRFADRGVVVLTVNSEDDPTAAREFLKEFASTFPVVRSGDDSVRTTFKTFKMPETFVVDPDGKFGLSPFRGEITSVQEAEIAAHLDAVLAR